MSLSSASAFQNNLAALATADPACLHFKRGIEKEGLRVTPEQRVSQQLHPQALGSTLTHPSITTDYSESLLEFITPVENSPEDVLAFLEEVHRYTNGELGDEAIWPASMPCPIERELDVPIAVYGSSNLGQLKHVYRRGLWHRYGRIMQCIAGLHYNFSVRPEMWAVLAKQCGQAPTQDFISARYFGLIRNFRRYSWLLNYLFGASPALDKSFVKGKEHDLETLDEQTLYKPYATSLRMSGLGYQNNAQASLFVCFNSLPTYTQTLRKAVKEPYARYEKIGVSENGEFKQLNTHLLQIENEYYADIRPKRTSQNGEKPLTALDRYGVEYIEVRCLDLNPFEPVGVSLQQIYFMDLFLAYCLLEDSPALTAAECAEVDANHRRVVVEGRDPEFKLKRQGEEISLQDWAEQLLSQLAPLAQLMDQQQNTTQFSAAMNAMAKRVADVTLTPSAQVLAALRDNQQSFAEFGFQQAHQFKRLLSAGLSTEALQTWRDLAEKSLINQQQIEESDTEDFAKYLTRYLQAL